MASPARESVGLDSSRAPLIAAAAVVAVCLAFAAFTGHMWEDYLITFRASLNLATGHGLVFQPGQRVHSFTSPLGTLLPALFALGGGDDVATRALWCLRVASALALGGALWLIVRQFLRSAFARFALGAGAATLVLDPKIVDYSINGMEVAFVVLFVAIAWRGFADGPRLGWCAAGLAGLQWTRPDGCVFFAALAGGWLLSGAPGAGTFRAKAGTVVRASLLGLLIYLPWLAFAWWYYGSPVPHTIVAKISPWTPAALAKALALYPWRLLFGHVALHTLFRPAYFFFGGWPDCLGWISRGIATLAAIAWLVPGVKKPGRIASATFFLGGFYVEYIPRSPWYFPGWEAIGWIAFGYLVEAGVGNQVKDRHSQFGWKMTRAAARIAGMLVVATQAALLVAVAWQMRQQQAIIETGHRREIGLWLRHHAASPEDRVFLEPLGYIGFYSGLKMYDYPGLSSPEVVAARRAGFKPNAPLIAELKPEWVVMRPPDAFDAERDRPGLLSHDYQVVRIFDARAQVDAVPFLPGRGYLDFDAVFLVFHRANAPAFKP